MQVNNDLKVGMPAPEFSVSDQDGFSHSLKDYRGKKLILFFFPKANTPGCTAEACNLRDNYEVLNSEGFAIMGVSADKAEAQKKWALKNNFGYPLIPDTEKQLINAYGAWGPKKFMGKSYEGILRYTYIIDEEGIIEKIFTKVATKSHAEQILNEYKS